jgi:Protein of unknwon function (DUF3310)
MASVSNPNDRQVGGTHYNQVSVQHWDLVLTNRLPYLEAQVTKYITRWKKKNQAVSDIDKAQHYLEKLIVSIEEGFLPLPSTTFTSCGSPRVPLTNLDAFAVQNKIGDIEKTIFYLLLAYTSMDELFRVRILLSHLMAEAKDFEATCVTSGTSECACP